MKVRTILTIVSAIACTAAASAAPTDSTFIQSALKSGTAEIREGSVQADTSDSYVHDFANKMVTDHTTANQELLALANQLHVRVPNGVGPMAGQSYSSSPINAQSERSPRLKPAAYFTQQIAAHRQAIALFEKEASSGGNDQVRAFAQKTLPVLHSHLAMAQKYLKIEKSKPQ